MSKQVKKKERAYGESRQHDTFVYPDECVSAECRAEAPVPTIVTREPPKEKYMRYQVQDINPKGYSNLEEVRESAQQIHQDVILDVIPIEKGIQRLNGVWMQVLKSGRDQFASKAAKEAARDILDEWLTKIRQKSM